MSEELDQLCVNTIRTLSIDAVEKANSGHPGMPLGMADAAYVLWTKFLRHNPADPKWMDRDRFILSAGHGSMLLYSLLHLTGYNLSLDELKNFRQWGSKTPGHPEYGLTEGVETTTGPLGQGFANGVGMAMAEAFLAETFNKPDHLVFDHYTYGIVSDGDLMEGITHEAASLAGHLKLGKIIYLYDDNNISIDGSTDITFTEDVLKRFEAYGWHTQEVDGHNRDEITEAISKAKKMVDQPSIIKCRTHIGYGSPNKQGKSSSHGAPLGKEEVALTKEALNWDADKHFYVPDEVKKHFEEAVQRGREWQAEWNMSLENYHNVYKEDAKILDQFLSDELPEEWVGNLPVFEADESGMATRKASGKVLNAIVDDIPNLIGGSADLAGSNKTTLDGKPYFSSTNYAGRNIHFGVREHAMTAALNGISLHGGLKTFGGTFLIFSDYGRPSVRLAALSKISPVFVYTHDSIGLGEDGPTHQPIEHLMALRAIPNVTLIRPADANETTYAWKYALEHKTGPTALVLTRQNLPVYERDENNHARNVERGAYILINSEKDTPDVILMGSGSEVQIAVDARELLADKGLDARVISMPSWEIFEKQDKSYKDSVLPSNVRARVSIEAGSPRGWEKWVGCEGTVIGIDHFGASAPYKTIYRKFGLTPEKMAEAAQKCFENINAARTS
jgi:transketolase